MCSRVAPSFCCCVVCILRNMTQLQISSLHFLFSGHLKSTLLVKTKVKVTAVTELELFLLQVGLGLIYRGHQEEITSPSHKDMPEEVMTASWKNFFVFLAGNTNDAHRDLVKKFKEAGHREVDSHQECDYCLVFCPIASRVGTDVSEALDRAPAGKPIILVVMHHTFNPNHVVAESRRLVENTNIHLTVDCLFYESRLLNCPTNEIAWFDIQKRLGFGQAITRFTEGSLASQVLDSSWKNFFVFSAGNTNDAHRDFVKKFKEAGHREVDSHQECDYCLVFCPVASRVGTDVSEALDRAPADKPIILVVMHHTFNPDHVVAESRRLVENTNVHLTVDCLFYESRLLNCRTNEIAWCNIQKHLGFGQSSQSSQVIDSSWKNFFVFSAGNTKDAHRDFVKKFKEAGHREVDSHQECDYCLVFCPVASRVGTDVSEALDRAPADKPIILVVMHHTFNPDHVVAESRRLVENTNVHLTVDCLFYETRLLNCPTNETAWCNIQKHLGFGQGSQGSQVIDYIKNNFCRDGRSDNDDNYSC
ncbi:uncharacterized protein [Trachinotus anak]|uniref:uncharacterized protein isoform X2 n=1 Tax=Trachinotus anak TaxID=443729 RepID=UPI0039F264E8